MHIRYVIGRAEEPQPPRVLASGKLSTAKGQDTTRRLYREACQRMDQPVSPELDAHLGTRDLRAWTYRLDTWAAPGDIGQALLEAAQVGRAMRRATAHGAVPPRNAWGCDRCPWSVHCENDASASDLGAWFGVVPGRPATEIRRKAGRGSYALRRDQPGAVVSPSEMRAWHTCERKWFLEYAQRLAPSEHRGFGPMVRGTVVHAGCQAGLEAERAGGMIGPAVHMGIADAIAEAADSFALSDDESRQAVLDLEGPAVDCSLRMIGEALVAEGSAGRMEVLEVEQRRIVRAPRSNTWITGQPDAIVRHPETGRLCVVEFKTSGSKDLERVAEGYRRNPAAHFYGALITAGQVPAEEKRR